MSTMYGNLVFRGNIFCRRWKNLDCKFNIVRLRLPIPYGTFVYSPKNSYIDGRAGVGNWTVDAEPRGTPCARANGGHNMTIRPTTVRRIFVIYVLFFLYRHSTLLVL